MYIRLVSDERDRMARVMTVARQHRAADVDDVDDARPVCFFFFVLVVVSACRVIASIAANENVTVIIELTELSFRFRSFDVAIVFNIDRLTAVSGKNTHEFKKFPL